MGENTGDKKYNKEYLADLECSNLSCKGKSSIAESRKDVEYHD